MKNIAIGVLKISGSTAIIAWLFWLALRHEPDALVELRNGDKNVLVLGTAVGLCLVQVVVTSIRWWLLVRAVGVPLPLRQAVRIGFVGYLFNLAPAGLVGGDILRAWMLCRRQRDRYAEAMASVAVDRLVGLYALLVVACAGATISGLWQSERSEIRYLCWASLCVATISTVGIVLFFAFDLGRHNSRWGLHSIPYVGTILGRFAKALRMYRNHLPALLFAGLMSLLVHVLLVVCIHLLAHGLPGASLTFPEHLAAVPLAGVTVIIPLPAGPQEGALEFLYQQLAGAGFDGLVVALAYRFSTVIVAGIGIIYCLGSRREVAETLLVIRQEEDAQAERRDGCSVDEVMQIASVQLTDAHVAQPRLGPCREST